MFAIEEAFARLVNSLLGGVDGFDEDKAAGEGDEGGVVLSGLFAA